MRAHYNVKARKRAVNLTLNEDLVIQARGVTDNLSAVVELLLAEYIVSEKEQRTAEATAVKQAIDTWNAFAEKHGSFADDHSTL